MLVIVLELRMRFREWQSWLGSVAVAYLVVFERWIEAFAVVDDSGSSTWTMPWRVCIPEALGTMTAGD